MCRLRRANQHVRRLRIQRTSRQQRQKCCRKGCKNVKEIKKYVYRFYCSFEEQVIRGILRDTIVADEGNSTTSHQKLMVKRQCGNSSRIIFQKSAESSISPPLSFFLEKTLGLSAIKVRKRLDFAHVRRKSESVVREGITSPETYYLLCHSSTSLTVSWFEHRDRRRSPDLPTGSRNSFRTVSDGQDLFEFCHDLPDRSP